jgi:hypothetical protein
VHEWITVVAHTEHGAVTLLDAATSRIRAELDGFAAPRYTAVHPRRPFAYVTDSAREEIVVVDAEHGNGQGGAEELTSVHPPHTRGEAREVPRTSEGSLLVSRAWTSRRGSVVLWARDACGS